MAGLRLENISKDFRNFPALSKINLSIKDGRFCVVLGPSGCGKSTLLNLIAGLEEASEGRIYLGERDITDLQPHKRNIAMVFQSYALYPHLSVFENIAFGLRLRKEKEGEIRAKVKKVSEILNIEGKLNKFPRELSGGERQRVATGRAIVREPEIFLFDEPLSNLDARLRIELRAEFIKLHRRLKKTIIYVTHDQIEALSIGEEIVVIRDGQIQQVSSPKELYQNPQNLFVAGFIGTPPMNIIQVGLRKVKNTLALVRDEFCFLIPADFQRVLENHIGRDIYFGFRPSAAKLTSAGQIKGEVVFTEVIGEDAYAHIRVYPGIELTAKLTEAGLPKPQVLVSVALDESKIYFFNSGGERIYI